MVGRRSVQEDGAYVPEYWFSTTGDSVPEGHWAMSGDILGCHNWGPGGVATGLWWGEVGDSAQHPIMHRPAPRANIQLQMSVLPN